MFTKIATVLLFLGVCEIVLSQSTTHPQFMGRAIVQHTSSGASVIANHSVPLYQAVRAIREEYGWRVSWEAAPFYSHYDLVDNTAPRWRAAHPNAKGATRPGGGAFASSFPEPQNPSDQNSERAVLAKVIEDYNATDNPGKFELREEPVGQFTVVGVKVRDEGGQLQEAVPVLDTPISITRERRTVYDTVQAILDQVSLAVGKKLYIADFSSSLFMNTHVTAGGDVVPARDLLRVALAGTNRTLQYDLLYDADISEYGLTTTPAVKAEINAQNERRITPIDMLTVPIIPHK